MYALRLRAAGVKNVLSVGSPLRVLELRCCELLPQVLSPVFYVLYVVHMMWSFRTRPGCGPELQSESHWHSFTVTSELGRPTPRDGPGGDAGALLCL